MNERYKEGLERLEEQLRQFQVAQEIAQALGEGEDEEANKAVEIIKQSRKEVQERIDKA